MPNMPSIEQFFVTLLERLFATLWNEFQVWISQPGNFDKALTYLDEILSSAGIKVNPDPNAPGQPTPAAPPPPNGTPSVGQSFTPAAPVTAETTSWFSGHNA